MMNGIAKDQSYDNTKVDVFSLGLLFIWIHAGSQPFKTMDNKEGHGYYLITQDFDRFWKYAEEVPTEPQFSDGFKDLVTKMV